MSIFKEAPIVVFPSLVSTNTIAHHYAIKGVTDGFGVGALLQTRGCGSRKRFWHSPLGNLYTSFVIGKARLQGFTPTQMVIAACMGIVDSLSRFHITEDIHIKWPNDVLIAGLKVSGLLIEHRMEQDGTSCYIVIGVGLNVGSFPYGAGLSACCLQDFTDDTIDFSDLRRSLQRNILENFSKMKSEPESMVSRYQKKLFAKGETINIRLQDKDLIGILRGVDNQGALLLETPYKLMTLYSGDIIVTPTPYPLESPCDSHANEVNN